LSIGCQGRSIRITVYVVHVYKNEQNIYTCVIFMLQNCRQEENVVNVDKPDKDGNQKGEI